MGAEIDVDVQELVALFPMLERLANADMSDLAENLASEIEAQTRIRILSEGPAPDGTPWEPWSPKYAETRHANQKMLLSTGRLLDSLKYGNPNNIHEVDSHKLVVGSNLVYAGVHQNGGEVGLTFGDDDLVSGGGFIPARPYLGISAENEKDLMDLTDLWLESLFTP